MKNYSMDYYFPNMVREVCCTRGFEDVNQFLWTELDDSEPVILVGIFIFFRFLPLNYS